MSVLRFRAAWLTVIAAVMVATALTTALSPPKKTPDSELFFRLADNLRGHGCLSQDDPRTPTCAPAWGSQPPGYVLFLAVVRTFSLNPTLVVVGQALLFSLGAWVLSAAVPAPPPGRRMVRLLVILFSPLTIAWGRWLLTETLATAAVMVSFAVFAQALRRGSVEWIPLVGALSAALLLRWDLLCLLVPAAALFFFLEGVPRFFKHAFICIVVVTIPYQLLSVRAMARGLSAAPRNTMDSDLPSGILRFWRLTALDQRATTGLIWPTWSLNYADVAGVDMTAFEVDGHVSEARRLIERVAALPRGADFPPDIDRDFMALTDRLLEDRGMFLMVVVPIKRTYRLWTRSDLQFYSGWDGLNPSREAETARTALRMLLLVGTLASPWLLGRDNVMMRRFCALVLLFVMARTSFLVSRPLTMLETRYLTEFFPLLEVVVMTIAVVRWRGQEVDSRRLPGV